MVQQSHRGPFPPGPARTEFLEHQPTYWLKRCYQALRRTVDQSLREFGLTLSQREVLLTLYVDGPLDQGTLRERLGLEQSSVSRLVDGLVRRGLVTLRAGSTDRRIRMASLTDEGQRLLARTPGASELAGVTMVAGLTHEERTQLVRLLKKCSENLTPRESSEEDGSPIGTRNKRRP